MYSLLHKTADADKQQ